MYWACALISKGTYLGWSETRKVYFVTLAVTMKLSVANCNQLERVYWLDTINANESFFFYHKATRAGVCFCWSISPNGPTRVTVVTRNVLPVLCAWKLECFFKFFCVSLLWQVIVFLPVKASPVRYHKLVSKNYAMPTPLQFGRLYCSMVSTHVKSFVKRQLSHYYEYIFV